MKELTEIKEKPNSFGFRWGGTGTDMKVYFEDADDLAKQLNRLVELSPELHASVQSFKEKMAGHISLRED
jgi:hypothetical protein